MHIMNEKYNNNLKNTIIVLQLHVDERCNKNGPR